MPSDLSSQPKTCNDTINQVDIWGNSYLVQSFDCDDTHLWEANDKVIDRLTIGKTSPKNAAVLLDFVQMRGGEGPAQIFRHLFISAFLVNKRSIFPPKCQ